MGSAWIKERQPEIHRNRVSASMGEIIADYCEFLEDHPDPTLIRDEKRLPHGKELILGALCMFIGSRAPRSELREALIASALSLSRFQKNVGDDLHPLGFDFSRLATMNFEESLKLIGRNSSGREKYDRMLPIVKVDADRIMQRVKAINSGFFV
jgi:hypothetical protein